MGRTRLLWLGMAFLLLIGLLGAYLGSSDWLATSAWKASGGKDLTDLDLKGSSLHRAVEASALRDPKRQLEALKVLSRDEYSMDPVAYARGEHLAWVSDRQIRGGVEHCLESSNKEVREAALIPAFRMYSGKQRARFAEKWLEHPDRRVRLQCLEEIRGAVDPLLWPILRKVVFSDPSRVVRDDALGLLFTWGGWEGVRPIVTGKVSEYPKTLRHKLAIELHTVASHAEAADAIVLLAQDPGEDVRRQALFYGITYASDEVATRLVRLPPDPSPSIRKQVKEMITTRAADPRYRARPEQ